MRFRFILITIIALSTMVAYAKDDPRSQLLAARSLKCHFGQGTSTTWPSGKPKTTPAQAGTDLDINFDSIAIQNRSARIIGNNGAGDVKVLATRVGLFFIHSAPAAFDVTTVFPIYGKGRDFIAVNTRHVMTPDLFAPGASMAEQYFGSCQIMQ
jgi:hypothetical protein